MDHYSGIEIAVIGMDGKFPGADNVEQLWMNLIEGKEAISHFTEIELREMGISEAKVKNPDYIRAKGMISDPECFDADFFQYSAKEAMLIDPQSRVFLETAWKALENAGYAPSKYAGKIGVYAGTAMNTYILRLAAQGALGSFDDFDIMLGNDKDLLSTRLSYKMNITGPSVTVQSTCSTSLVAVHLACQSLLSGECDMAISGGVSIQFPIKQGYTYVDGMIYSKDGQCRPFDENANGTVFSDGVGVVVLKRLEDALEDNDSIYAVIKGSAINNDGMDKVGFTAPSISGQSKVINEALMLAEINPETIQYVEAHGTGTKIGDPIEMKALTNTFRQSTDKKQYCAIGSIKANIGHLNTASGIAGFIKTVLALKNKQIPPSIHVELPNKELFLETSPFYINQQAKHWEAGHVPRRASVSSFGIGGTNAYVVLEEAPQLKDSGREDEGYYLLPLSARTQRALHRNAVQLGDFIKNSKEAQLKDIGYTLSTGREEFEYRAALVGKKADSNVEENLRDISIFTNKVNKEYQKPVYFLFPGQGSQYVNMAKDLYDNEEIFRENMNECARVLQLKLGRDILEILYPDEADKDTSSELLAQTELTQPVIFTIEYALSKLLMSWGVMPQAMIGHSLGEYVAACIAGVMELEDALAIIAERGKLIQNQPQGQMLAVRLSKEEITPYLRPNLSLAAENGPQLCVLSGDYGVIEATEEELKAKNIFTQRLKTSHAFHSHMMEDAVKPFEDYIGKFELKRPQIPFVSNVTGKFITDEEAMSPKYWAEHIRKPVLFTRGIANLLNEEKAIFIEVGPGSTLIGLARQQGSQENIYANLIRHPYENTHDQSHLLHAIGTLWSHGAHVHLLSLYKGEYKRINLPTYSFEKVHYSLLTSQNAGSTVEHSEANITKIPLNREKLTTEYIAPSNETEQVLLNLLEEILGVSNVGIADNFFDLGGDSLIASRYAAMVNETLFMNLSIEMVIESGNIEALASRIEDILLAEIENMTDEQAEEALSRGSL